ncbi:hypothetical protein OSB04_018361 [Centaurea solstitialis]|uniref:Uncharacterized protein n=1 Tax=Centaurea solstitialis TaxID=347529 RepID=A0AA38WMX1_9ASTR|nr:hypothetical protein OSB04_018361 [Centaurea solstitialis]
MRTGRIEGVWIDPRNRYRKRNCGRGLIHGEDCCAVPAPLSSPRPKRTDHPLGTTYRDDAGEWRINDVQADNVAFLTFDYGIQKCNYLFFGKHLSHAMKTTRINLQAIAKSKRGCSNAVSYIKSSTMLNFYMKCYDSRSGGDNFMKALNGVWDSIMASAEALAVLLKQLLIDINEWLETPPFAEEEEDHRREIAASFDVLLNHLRKMMLGYENDEVEGLLNDIEVLVPCTSGRLWIQQSPIDKMLDTCEKLCNIRFSSTIEAGEIVVGFDGEIETLLDQLTGTSTKQLQVVPIAGMAGLGKTTLARRLYRDPLIEYVFDIRAWTSVSQVYQKRDLLLGILSSFINDPTEEINEMGEEQLGEKLYRLLKGRQYLVVLDDIWDCKAWNDLRMYFPDDKTGSRILFTSRDIDLKLHVRDARPAHVLRLRTEDESWLIFQAKVFKTGICPRRLEAFGKVVTRKCEGFIHETGCRSLEDVAQDLLMDLIKRSLLMTAKMKVDGQIKACRIHDLLRDLCLRKAKEGYFSPQSFKDVPVPAKASSSIVTNMQHGMSVDPPAVPSPSGFCRPFGLGNVLEKVRSILRERCKSLRVLDLESVRISLFPFDVIGFANLRYLAIQARDGTPQPSISNLVHLQMLIISSRKNIVVPKTIWNMVNLRHIYIKSGENLMEEPCFVQVPDKDGCPNVLSSLQTLSQVSPQSCHNIFSRIPNLRNLGLCGPLISSKGDLEFPNIRSLEHLEKLKLLNTIPFPEATRSCIPLMFPEKLRKLTLSNTGMEWEQMWTLAWLPNLEVLRLKFHACIGEKWDTSDAKFEQLKILKLQSLDLRQWVCWRDNFPGLQRLVVRQCLKLESIPSDIGKILTLDVIEVRGCSRSARVSAQKIQKEQENEGNCFLKGRTMDDAVALILKQLFSFNDHQFFMLGRLQRKIEMDRILNGLMNAVRKMMLGYENEGVHNMVKRLEKVAHSSSVFGPQPSLMDEILEIIEELCNIRYGPNIGEEVVVGFDDEVETLLDQLTTTSAKEFQVISITGMAGVGKTTLARQLYKDPLIKYVFDIRAWTCVSQAYLKRDLLLGILSSFINYLTEEIYKMSDEQLGGKLYRLLKGRKYLVVLDDIWDCMPWNDLRFYFPDDQNGSRVLFTSRDIDVSLHVQAARPAHVLRLRTADESWDIFQKKVFRTGICFPRLRVIGWKIAKKCKGLPLAIVIIAGLVKNQLSFGWWSEIAGSLHSFMVRDPSQYMDTLALSYNHLPPHLRTCFLFLGVFPEDYDIPVTKLIWLWIAQGFIHETENRILEDVAEDFLMDLIKRSLLMTAKKRADGQVKACRIHDLMRDLCLRKAKEEDFSAQIYGYASVPESSSTIINMLHGMSFNPPALITHSGFCYPFEFGKILQKGGLFLRETYKSLKILDVESILIFLFPFEVIQLDSLRCLAIQAHDGSPQASISNLVNLQMLVISSRKNIVVPKSIWNMVNLRHLYIKSGENVMEEPCFIQATEKDGCPNGLVSLQTLSQVSPQSCHNIFSRTPNLRKLGFCGPLMSKLGDLEFPSLRSLKHLQKLKLLNTNPYPEPTRSCNPILFPENLKKLTLSNTGMDWEEMWTFSLLPNLEVLKLKFNAFIGEKWETDDAEFRSLKVLKLLDLELSQWVCSRENFPGLQRLVVHHCSKLNSIPSDVGNILTLDVIEVQGCSRSAWVSAQNIQKEQESEGNCFLKVQGTNNVLV